MASRGARFDPIPLRDGASRERDREQIARSLRDSGRRWDDWNSRMVAQARTHTYRVYAGATSAAAFCGATAFAIYSLIGK